MTFCPADSESLNRFSGGLMRTPIFARTPIYAAALGVITLLAAGTNPASKTSADKGATVAVAKIADVASTSAAAPRSPAEVRTMEVDSAMDALEGSVVKQSHEGALRE